LTIREAVDLQSLNTLRVPSTAQHFAELEHPAELDFLLIEARLQEWPITVLGEGSNVVLGQDLPGLVLRQGCKGKNVLATTHTEVTLRAAAGENWHGFVGWCLEQGYCGLENLALIPGTVGAAPIQNIGAYGVEVGPFIESVHCRELPSGEPLVLERADCEFGYRDSVFKHRLRDAVLIESVTFRLPLSAAPVTTYPSLAQWLEEAGTENPTPQQVFDAVVAIRSSRLPDPAEVPNAGSFFKNPVVSASELARIEGDYPDLPRYDDPAGFKLPAAWLIDQCGFKQREGDVRVHAEHALVIINPERRPAGDIAALAAAIRDAVADRFGIALEQEPRGYNS
jgi:UDP-N-acetylmuramate dehydrogenase